MRIGAWPLGVTAEARDAAGTVLQFGDVTVWGARERLHLASDDGTAAFIAEEWAGPREQYREAGTGEYRWRWYRCRRSRLCVSFGPRPPAYLIGAMPLEREGGAG